MEQMIAQLGGLGGMGRPQQPSTKPLSDTAETVHISSLSLLKMLIHARAGVPLEVMGLMIGEYIDEYTVRVVDVFSMPQTATGQSVEAVDPEYQSQMLEKLEQVGRPEKVVGWYHSHPGFGCWLSDEDVVTAKGYENLTPRSVSVVVDPIQSVRGKVVIDAFRTISREVVLTREETRQTTSTVGFLFKPSPQALVHGYGRTFYNMPVNFRKNASEIHMLRNVHKKSWMEGLKLSSDVINAPPSEEEGKKGAFAEHEKRRNESVKLLKDLTHQCERFIASGKDEDDVGNVGKIIPTTHLLQEAETLISANLDQNIGIAINAIIF